MVAGDARASEGLHRSAANLASRLPLRVILDRLTRSHQPAHVRFALKATVVLRCREMTRRANSGHDGKLYPTIHDNSGAYCWGLNLQPVGAPGQIKLELDIFYCTVRIRLCPHSSQAIADAPLE